MKTLFSREKGSMEFKQTRLFRNAASLWTALFLWIVMAFSSFATEPGGTTPGGSGGDDAWSEIIGFIQQWLPRLGGAIIVVGLAMFGLGWQRDDADGKTRGIQVIIGGAIVAAAGGMTHLMN